jgi:hypothetical protein
MLFAFRRRETMTCCMKRTFGGRVVASRRNDTALADEI